MSAFIASQNDRGGGERESGDRLRPEKLVSMTRLEGGQPARGWATMSGKKRGLCGKKLDREIGGGVLPRLDRIPLPHVLQRLGQGLRFHVAIGVAGVDAEKILVVVA